MFRLRNLFLLFKRSPKLLWEYLVLLNFLLFSIIIIVDIIAFFQERDLEFLIILTVLISILVAYSQGFYFGNLSIQIQSKEIKLSSDLKPEVRIVEKPMTEGEYQDFASRQMEEK